MGIFGPERFPLAPEILFDHLPGRRQNCSGGAVILLQPDNLHTGKILLELQDVADIGAAPGIDRLVVIPHHAQVAALSGQQADQMILHRVGVLVFIHQNPLETLPVITADFREAGQQAHGLDHHIAEIESVTLLQPFLISGVDLHHPLVVDIARWD